MALAVLLVSAASPARAEDVTFPLVADGRPVADVVVAGDNETLAAAVEDFRVYVRRITGAELAIHRGADDLPGPTLHVGETALFAKTEEARRAVKYDGFAIARVGEDLVVVGNLPFGTANGLWTILQDQFGVRWYHPGPLWEVVPSKTSLAIVFAPDAGGEARVENPSFVGRRDWSDLYASEYGRRLRLSQKGMPMPYVGSGHALAHACPTAKYAKDHPDYFPLIDGRRVLDGEPNPCFTHPDMFDVMMAYVRGGGTGFGVNDNLTACRCERCLAVDGKSPPYMGMWNVSESCFQLLARVAKQTAKEFPGKRLGCFAYQLTNTPPRTVDTIGDNFDIVLCQDTAQYFDPEVKRNDQEMSAEWVKKTGGVSFYDYIGIDYWVPRYFPHILADQLRHIARAGVKGYGTHTPTMPDSAMPMFYLLYRMLWNAEQNPDALLDGMIRDLYGEAAGPMKSFYDHWERCWTRQKKGRWFYGMDDFRAEMRIYTPEDIAEGRRCLDAAAAAAAKDETVRKRIAWLDQYYVFTEAASRAYFVSVRAIEGPAPESPEAARALSGEVAAAWTGFADVLARVEKLPGCSVSGWHPKTFRVRAWALKQQMRDAALMAAVRWACVNEGRFDPKTLRERETDLAAAAEADRKAIDERVTDCISAAPRLPRANGLRVADVPRAKDPPPPGAGEADWPGVPRVDVLPWVFRLRPAENAKKDRYAEPVDNVVVDPPAAQDQSMTWQCAWDEKNLYIRVVVTDDKHVQSQPAPAMWKEDSLQVAINPHRDRLPAAPDSWDYLMGGYRGEELEFGVALHGDATEVNVWKSPALPGRPAAAPLVKAAAARRGERTIYECAVDWRWVHAFVPGPERSLGITLVVNDVDPPSPGASAGQAPPSPVPGFGGTGSGLRRSAEWGGGVVEHKRPTEFGAVRLVE